MLAYGNEKTQKRREIVLAARRKDGWALEFAVEKLRGDQVALEKHPTKGLRAEEDRRGSRAHFRYRFWQNRTPG